MSKRWTVTSDYVALYQLPLNYNTVEKLGFNQYFSVPVTNQELKRKLDDVDKAEQKLYKINSWINNFFNNNYCLFFYIQLIMLLSLPYMWYEELLM